MKLEISDMKKCINEKIEGLIKECDESMDDMQVEHNRTTSKGIESLQKKTKSPSKYKISHLSTKEKLHKSPIILESIRI